MNRAMILLAAFVISAFGCERREPQKASVPLTGAPTLAELKNATYSGIEELSGPVTLKDGEWQGSPLEGGSSRPRLYYARDFHLTGDLDGDGSQDAVALLGFSNGGSGERLYVSAVRRENGKPDCMGTGLLGDRVQVRDARVENGRIYLDIVRAGDGDAMCCPGELATSVWQVTPDGFVEVRNTATGRLSVAALYGGEWVMRWWDWSEAAPAQPEVTVRFYDNRVAGNDGCNRYLATIRDGDSPGDASLTAPVATRMECPEAQSNVEKRFLAQLAAVTRYSFVTGMLSLEYTADGKTGIMLFEHRAMSEDTHDE